MAMVKCTLIFMNVIIINTARACVLRCTCESASARALRECAHVKASSFPLGKYLL